MKVLLSVVFFMFFIFIVNCGGNSNGSLGEKCYPDGTCENGFVCDLTTNQCVPAGDDIAITDNEVSDNDYMKYEAVCGNGVLEAGESCEPSKMKKILCSEMDPRYVSGNVSCNTNCTFSLSDCVFGGTCGNGIIETGEMCDDGNTVSGDGCSSNCFSEKASWGSEGTDPCGVPESDSSGNPTGEPDIFCDNPTNRDTYVPDKEVKIRIRTHVISKGTLVSAKISEVQQIVDVANQFFAPSKIELIWDGSVDTIVNPSDPLYNYYDLSKGNFNALTVINNAPSAIDIYFVNTFSDLCGRAADIGLPSSGVDSVVLKTSCGGATLAHELGHILGLWHTHHGTAENPTCSNCDNSCDLCCDTAYDPCRISGEGSGLCTPTASPSCTTACSDGSTPDVYNVMSYYDCANDPANGHFSNNQISRMLCYIDKQYQYALEGETEEECKDKDGDGYGDPASDVCLFGLLDCDDNDKTINPGAKEICDNKDNDCNDKIDDGIDPLTQSIENRCPSKGICASGAAKDVCKNGKWECEFPTAYVETECPVVNTKCGSGAFTDTTCRDEKDNDCDGAVDENNQYWKCLDHEDYYKVQQGIECFASDYGRCALGGGTYECIQLAETCGVNIDCVDAVFPEEEKCDNQDWNCDGKSYNRNDIDKDGYGDCAGYLDCNESNAAINPGATEICDGVDNDCDGSIDEGVKNACGTCGVVPQEVCDGVDNDCDGTKDEGTCAGQTCRGDGVCVNTSPNFDILQHITEVGDRLCSGANGKTCATAPSEQPIQGFSIDFTPNVSNLSVEYKVYMRDVGYSSWISEPTYAGTRNESRPIMGFAVRLTGTAAKYYSVCYRGYISFTGYSTQKCDGVFYGPFSNGIEDMIVTIALK